MTRTSTSVYVCVLVCVALWDRLVRQLVFLSLHLYFSCLTLSLSLSPLSLAHSRSVSLSLSFSLCLSVSLSLSLSLSLRHTHINTRSLARALTRCLSLSICLSVRPRAAASLDDPFAIRSRALTATGQCQAGIRDDAHPLSRASFQQTEIWFTTSPG